MDFRIAAVMVVVVEVVVVVVVVAVVAFVVSSAVVAVESAGIMSTSLENSSARWCRSGESLGFAWGWRGLSLLAWD
jgi:hypothetical protein